MDSVTFCEPSLSNSSVLLLCLPDVSGLHRFKEEAEGSTTDLKEQLAAAHEERHAVEEQAKQQVKSLTSHCLPL